MKKWFNFFIGYNLSLLFISRFQLLETFLMRHPFCIAKIRFKQSRKFGFTAGAGCCFLYVECDDKRNPYLRTAPTCNELLDDLLPSYPISTIMKRIFFCLVFILVLCTAFGQNAGNATIIGSGHVPAIAIDNRKNIHIAYGSGDSIMYVFSKNGVLFTNPALVGTVPRLFSFAMRGPQIAVTRSGVVITACTKDGNIFSFHKDQSGRWQKTGKVNDENNSAKEGLMSLSGEGLHVFAIWLAVKKPKGQNILGAFSADEGKTWTRNILVYASPDSTVCECCKPSTVLKGNKVFVMFRNWLHGNRDLYLVISNNEGKAFGPAQKLGNGNWKLNGCPMDGGGLVINNTGIAQTIWRREHSIYFAVPGGAEERVGEGSNCSIESINDKNIFAWTEKGNVIVMRREGQKINLGQGSLPLIKAINQNQAICVWENGNTINSSLVEL